MRVGLRSHAVLTWREKTTHVLETRKELSQEAPAEHQQNLAPKPCEFQPQGMHNGCARAWPATSCATAGVGCKGKPGLGNGGEQRVPVYCALCEPTTKR